MVFSFATFELDKVEFTSSRFFPVLASYLDQKGSQFVDYYSELFTIYFEDFVLSKQLVTLSSAIQTLVKSSQTVANLANFIAENFIEELDL